MPTTAAFHSYAYKKIMFPKTNEKISCTNLGHLVLNILNSNWTVSYTVFRTPIYNIQLNHNS